MFSRAGRLVFLALLPWPPVAINMIELIEVEHSPSISYFCQKHFKVVDVSGNRTGRTLAKRIVDDVRCVQTVS
jgi:hypothetical protein